MTFLKLWELGNLRTGARNHDIPSLHGGAANARFIADLDRQQAELLDTFGYLGREEKAWYDETGEAPVATPWPQPGPAPVATPAALLESISNKPFPVAGPTPYPKPKDASIAYVFYTDSPEAEFAKQAAYQRKVLIRQGYEVKMVCVDDVGAFVKAWDNMDAKTRAAVIISHSNGMSLIFEHNSPVNAISAMGRNAAGNEIPAIYDLGGPDLDWLSLLACNAGHEELFSGRKTNAADAFRDLPNVDTVYAYDGSVGFGLPIVGGPILFPRLANDQSGYYEVFSTYDIPYSNERPSGKITYESD